MTPDDEWHGLARMAAAGRASGRELTGVERDALKRFPDPEFLTEDGYRPRGSG